MKKRILIVDDEPDLAWLVKLNLERTTQYEVATETNPIAAVETARAFLPDIVLLDLVMPQRSGGELAAQIETALAPRSVRIIFLTAALPNSRTNGAPRNIAGYQFLAKPIATTQLLYRSTRLLCIGTCHYISISPDAPYFAGGAPVVALNSANRGRICASILLQ